MKQLSCLLVGALLACGGSSPEPQPPAGANDGEGDAAETTGEHAGEKHANGEKHADGEKHEHNFPPTLDAYHKVLSPIWHAEKGEARNQAACDAIEAFAGAGDGVQNGAVPEKAAADKKAWDDAAMELVSHSVALGALCSEKAPAAEIEEALKKIHDAFHVLTAQVGEG